MDVVVTTADGDEILCGTLGDLLHRVLVRLGVTLLARPEESRRLDERLAAVIHLLLEQKVWRFDPRGGGSGRPGFAIDDEFSTSCYRAFGSKYFYRGGSVLTSAIRLTCEQWAREKLSEAGASRGGTFGELAAEREMVWPMRASGIVNNEDRDKLFTAWRILFVESDSPKSLVALDENSGVDVQEVQAILGRIRISPQAKAAGYQDAERFGLFTTLDEHAEPQLPAFAQRICNDLVSRGQEWSYETAQREWFWGYAWEGAKPLES